MNIITFLSRGYIASLIILVLRIPAFCGEIQSTDSYRVTALHLAARNGQQDIAELLLAKGAEVNTKEENGWTPLHEAAFMGHTEMAALLISKGANIDAKDNKGYTPLHLASERGHKDVTELLLSKGADLNAKTNGGMMSLDTEASRILLAPPALTNPRPLIPADKLTAATPSVKVPIDIPLDLNVPIGDILAPPGPHTASSGSGTGGGIGTGTGTGIGSGMGSGAGRGRGSGLGDGIGTGVGNGEGPYVARNLDKQPVPVNKALPPYTEDARKARIEGIVVLQAIIRKDGTVDSFKVIKGLGHGLDDSAINTIASKWRFSPGTLKGVPVDVVANIEVRFRMFNKKK
jgi:TonB family protein